MKKLAKLDVKDSISVMYLSQELVKVAWFNYLPKEYSILVNEISAWRVFEALIQAQAEGFQSTSSLSKVQERTGLSRQLVSKTLNRFVKLGWVVTGTYDNDKRNKLYFFVPETSLIVAEAMMLSLSNVCKALIDYVDNDATIRILNRLDNNLEQKVDQRMQGNKDRRKKPKALNNGTNKINIL